jgi:hypothetical protein
MTNARQKARRWWRPKFTLKALVALVTLMCAYLACWGPTQGRGIVDVARRIVSELPPLGWVRQDFVDTLDAASPMPLIVSVNRGDYSCREYYVWFFGFTARLPYSRSLPPAPFPPDEEMMAGEAEEGQEDHP